MLIQEDRFLLIVKTAFTANCVTNIAFLMQLPSKKKNENGRLIDSDVSHVVLVLSLAPKVVFSLCLSTMRQLLGHAWMKWSVQHQNLLLLHNAYRHKNVFFNYSPPPAFSAQMAVLLPFCKIKKKLQ
jgi:hypothetical protein